MRRIHSKSRPPQSTIKSALVAMVIIGLAVGWIADRRSLQLRFNTRLQQEKDQRTHTQTRLNNFVMWYAENHSLECLPAYYDDLITAASSIDLNPKHGFRLFVVKDAEGRLLYGGASGRGWRVRGGPFKYELLGEDLSGAEPRVVYRLAGPNDVTASQNTDAVFSFIKPRSPFRPYLPGAERREPSEENYVVTFSQESIEPIKVPSQDVWPSWIYTAPGIKRTGASEMVDRSGVIPPNNPLPLFCTEIVASDGHKARVQLTITCGPQVPDSDATDNQVSAHTGQL